MKRIAVGLFILFAFAPFSRGQWEGSATERDFAWRAGTDSGGSQVAYLYRHGQLAGIWYLDHQRFRYFSDGAWGAPVQTAPVRPPEGWVRRPIKNIDPPAIDTRNMPSRPATPIQDSVPNFGVVKSEINQDGPRTVIHNPKKVGATVTGDVPDDGEWPHVIFISDTLDEAKRRKTEYLASPEGQATKTGVHFHAMAKSDERLKCGYKTDDQPNIVYGQDAKGKVLFRTTGDPTPAVVAGAVRRMPNQNYDPSKDPIAGGGLLDLSGLLRRNIALVFAAIGAIIFVWVKNAQPKVATVPVSVPVLVASNPTPQFTFVP